MTSPHPSPGPSQPAEDPAEGHAPWAWGAYLPLGAEWLVVPSDLPEPGRWAAAAAEALCEPGGPDSDLAADDDRPDPAARAELARVLDELAGYSAAERPILTALWHSDCLPVAGLSMRPAPLADGVTDPDGLLASWGRYPTSVGEPEHSTVDLLAGPAVRRLDRLRTEPGTRTGALRRLAGKWSRAALRETLTYVVFVQPGETLVVEAQWYHLAFGARLERQIDDLLATLVIERD